MHGDRRRESEGKVLSFGVERGKRRESKSEMSSSAAPRSLLFLILFLSISIHFLSGLANDSTNDKNENKAASHDTSRSFAGLKIILVCLGLVAVIAFCVFLFKLWQKKRREEQQARLLKLFEDDDELEVELGMRD